MRKKNYVRVAFFKHDVSLLLNAFIPLIRRSTARGRPFQGFRLLGLCVSFVVLSFAHARSRMDTDRGRTLGPESLRLW